MDDWWTSLRSGMWKLYYQLSAEGRRRYYDEMIPVLDRTKEEVMGERNQDCYYLVYIGTKPNAQGRGYAGKLIRDMVAKVLQLMSTCSIFHRWRKLTRARPMLNSVPCISSPAPNITTATTPSSVSRSNVTSSLREALSPSRCGSWFASLRKLAPLVARLSFLPSAAQSSSRETSL